MLLDLFGQADEEPQRPGPDPESEARRILAEAVERWDPLAVVALFSGGNDSTCAARIAAESPRFAGCLLADTGIAIPEAHEHARATAARCGWPLILERTPECYETLVLAEGFPGPAKHWLMYQRLKERAFQAGVQRVKRGRRFPDELAAFYIELCTAPETDLVVDFLAGGQTVAEQAERLRRQWLTCERALSYIAGGAGRFADAHAFEASIPLPGIDHVSPRDGRRCSP